MIPIKVTVYDGTFSVVPHYGHYSNDRLAVQLLDELSGELIVTLSVNIPNAPDPGPNRFYLKDWSENAEIAAFTENILYRIIPGHTVPAGFVFSELAELLPPYAQETQS